MGVTLSSPRRGHTPWRATVTRIRRRVASGGGSWTSAGRATTGFSPLAEELRALAAVHSSGQPRSLPDAGATRLPGAIANRKDGGT